ncbi:hypothetical protein ALQ30_200025 [Pseudomonas syringae pv. persicae]|uniref:Uncharacterized protein n=1 Tax=Pseudomonas syringae pv. persicae TaxID=237306 RepID=A0A3M4B3A6_9PSED|nr:hypothetical protein ALQ30_200025 [Pseudomonas syringae pv. persicae]
MIAGDASIGPQMHEVRYVSTKMTHISISKGETEGNLLAHKLFQLNSSVT